MTTIKDIARECGVFANTVSSVNNNKPGQVSAKTRPRVLSAIQRLGYRPNAAARRMVGKRTHTLGIADRHSPLSLSDSYKTQILEPIVQRRVPSAGTCCITPAMLGKRRLGGFPAFWTAAAMAFFASQAALRRKKRKQFFNPTCRQCLLEKRKLKPQWEQARQEQSSMSTTRKEHTWVFLILSAWDTRIAMVQDVGIYGNRNRVMGYRRALTQQGLTIEEALLCPSPA